VAMRGHTVVRGHRGGHRGSARGTEPRHGLVTPPKEYLT
jgi:hypothetical protein